MITCWNVQYILYPTFWLQRQTHVRRFDTFLQYCARHVLDCASSNNIYNTLRKYSSAHFGVVCECICRVYSVQQDNLGNTRDKTLENDPSSQKTLKPGCQN